MPEDNVVKPFVPIPLTQQGLLDMRALKNAPILADLVEPVVIALWAEAEFRKLLAATDNSEASEGSLVANYHHAAEMIREASRKKDPKGRLSTANLHAVRKAVLLVMRRLQLTPKQRNELYLTKQRETAELKEQEAA